MFRMLNGKFVKSLPFPSRGGLHTFPGTSKKLKMFCVFISSLVYEWLLVYIVTESVTVRSTSWRLNMRFWKFEPAFFIMRSLQWSSSKAPGTWAQSRMSHPQRCLAEWKSLNWKIQLFWVWAWIACAGRKCRKWMFAARNLVGNSLVSTASHKDGRPSWGENAVAFIPRPLQSWIVLVKKVI